ncbi:MAG: Wzz/FepE/Etk N-terminal domain-containing protein [Candidatus Latescibacteria bacterium]|nr:Wzz/FepE/Etk N-terminal domain-containing protein [Candidatus Latescibacterota bacterium]
MLFFFQTLVAWRRFILLGGLASAAAMGILSFVLPKWYTARTSIFPPEPAIALPMYAELVQQLSAPLLGPTASGAAPETIYLEMIKSRTVGEKVIAEFDLMNAYGESQIETCLEALHSHLGFTLLDNGLLIVTFEDRDPVRAAAIANRMIQLLDETTRGLKVSRAGRTRDFIERQLTDRERLLAQAETDLKVFQQEFDTVDLDEQLRSAMDIVTSLSARAIALDTELRIMAHYTSKKSEEYIRKQTEYNEVVRQLARLKVSVEGGDDDLVRSYIPALGDVPEVALQYIRLRRAVEVQTTVYKMLVSEYEKARIEEARDTPVVQVLDPASPPSLRSRPKRKLLIAAGLLLGLGWSSAVALFATAWRDNTGRSDKLRRVLGPLAYDVKRFRRRRNSP